MKNCKTLLLKGLFSAMLLAVLYAPAAFARDVILRVAVVDEIAFISEDILRSNEYLQNHFPNAKLVTIFLESKDPKVLNRNEIHDQIEAKLQPQDRVRMLVIDDHGSTVVKEELYSSSLQNLGRFSSDWIDPKFDDIFGGIRSKTTADLRVVFNSCQIFCGPKEMAAGRAQNLLKYFNAPQGSVYGAVTDEVERKFAKFRWKTYLRDWKFLVTSTLFTSGFTAAAGLVYGQGYLGLTFHQDMDSLIRMGAIGYAAGFVATITSGFLLRPVLEKAKTQNMGYLFHFFKGNLITEELVSKFDDFNKIHGINKCQFAFAL